MLFGQAESKRGQQETGNTASSLIYGEVEFKSFFYVLRWIQKTFKDKDADCWHNAFNQPGGTFLDLGHGAGKGLLCAALAH